MAKRSIRRSRGDGVLQVITNLFLVFVLILVAYPVIYVVSCSFSGTNALMGGRVLLWPVDLSTKGYEFVLQYKQVWIGYRNSIFYTALGVSITMLLNILSAYPLSRPELRGRTGILIFFYITTLVSAGMIPTFIIKTKLGLFDTIWAVVLAGALGVQHVIILKTAFSRTVPSELYDAAAIDGANHLQILCSIALPLTKSTLAVLALYSAVGCWNEYFNSMIYLRNEDLYPLQLFLRNILTAAESIDTTGISSSAMLQQAAEGTKQVQYALIVISTVPLVALYFLAQKNFKKGIMIGSVKG